MRKTHLAAALAAAGVALAGAGMAFGGAERASPRGQADFSPMVGVFCTEALVALRRTPGFEDFTAYGFPAVALTGEQPTFLCPARNWRGAYILRVRGVCPDPERCAVVENVQDSKGRVVYSGS